MADQIRPISEMSLTELFAVKEEHGENTAEAVLEAIEAKQKQEQTATAPATPVMK